VLDLAWHIAALMRTERLPSYEALLAPPKTEAELAAELEESERDMREMLANRAAEKSTVKLNG